MSNLISNRRATSRGSQTPSPGGNVAATSTPDMATTGVPPVAHLGPTVSTAAASSTSSMTHPVLSSRQTHRRPRLLRRLSHLVTLPLSMERGPRQVKKKQGPLQKDFSDHSHHDPEDHHYMGSTTSCSCDKEAAQCVGHRRWLRYQEPLPLRWESWRAVPQETKDVVHYELSHHYELSNLDSNQKEYINDLCSSRFTHGRATSTNIMSYMTVRRSL